MRQIFQTGYVRHSSCLAAKRTLGYGIGPSVDRNYEVGYTMSAFVFTTLKREGYGLCEKGGVMARPSIDGRPKIYCNHCYKFVGVHEESRYCDCCGKLLRNVVLWCQDNRRAHDEEISIWAYALTLDGFIAALGYTFKQLQNFNLVDIAYYTALALVPVITYWYIHKYVRPQHPTVYANKYFKPGRPEDPPREQRGLGKHQ